MMFHVYQMSSSHLILNGYRTTISRRTGSPSFVRGPALTSDSPIGCRFAVLLELCSPKRSKSEAAEILHLQRNRLRTRSLSPLIHLSQPRHLTPSGLDRLS